MSRFVHFVVGPVEDIVTDHQFAAEDSLTLPLPQETPSAHVIFSSFKTLVMFAMLRFSQQTFGKFAAQF
jgi:hypothetical protein